MYLLKINHCNIVKLNNYYVSGSGMDVYLEMECVEHDLAMLLK